MTGPPLQQTHPWFIDDLGQHESMLDRSSCRDQKLAKRGLCIAEMLLHERFRLDSCEVQIIPGNPLAGTLNLPLLLQAPAFASALEPSTPSSYTLPTM